jgi:two-component system NarL family sensor kinase
MTNPIVVFGGLLVCFLSMVFILFFIIARQRQNQLVIQQKRMQETFEKQLLQSRLEIQEQTFNRIGEEIHDNVGQVLSLAKVQINIMNESDSMSREMLGEVKENIGRAMSDLRDIARSLSSERIRSLSIYAAVSAETERINKTGIVRAVLSAEGTERQVDEQKKLILLRIIQESLQNSIKHANASEIRMNFTYQPDKLVVAIADNGKGFDTEAAIKTNTGLGLLNIKTRAALIGGDSSIESVLREGTKILIRIPYE